MKTAIIYGIASMNLGDDLFFQIVKDRYPKTRFIMVAPRAYKGSFGVRWGGIVVAEDSFLARFSAFLGKLFRVPSSAFLYLWLMVRYRVDVFMIVGGSLFMEGKSHVPSFIKGINRMRRLRPHMRIVVIGSNFGPYETEKWKQEVGSALRQVDDVCFRDWESYIMFSSMPNVRWGNDIAMHLGFEPIGRKQKVVCVNIRSVEKWPSLKPYKTEYLKNVKSLIDYFQQDSYDIKLISFCEKYGDNEITKELFDSLDNKNGVEVMFYDGDLHRILSQISRSEIMIGTRFHAIMLGLFFNLKVIPISYSIKTENMLKTYNLWKDIYDFRAFCNSPVEDIMQSLITTHSIDSHNNTMFEYLDKVLDNEYVC